MSGETRLIPGIPTAQDDLRISHSERGQVTYRWYVNDQLQAGEGEPLLRAGRFSKGDRITAVVAFDGKESSVSATAVNAPPKVLSVIFSDPQEKGANITAEPKGYDADGDPVRFRFQWTVNGNILPEEGPAVERSRFRKGDEVSLTVTPSDDESEGDAYEAQAFVIPNAPPRFTSPPMAAFSASGYQYRAQAEDPDGDPLVFSLPKAPPGMAIDSRTGLVTWALDNARAGEQEVEIVVQDSEGLKSSQHYTINVTLPEEVKDEKK